MNKREWSYQIDGILKMSDNIQSAIEKEGKTKGPNKNTVIEYMEDNHTSRYNLLPQFLFFVLFKSMTNNESTLKFK